MFLKNVYQNKIHSPKKYCNPVSYIYKKGNTVFNGARFMGIQPHAEKRSMPALCSPVIISTFLILSSFILCLEVNCKETTKHVHEWRNLFTIYVSTVSCHPIHV